MNDNYEMLEGTWLVLFSKHLRIIIFNKKCVCIYIYIG